MRFGTFHLFPWHEDKSPEQVLQESIEVIRVSEELGFDSAWLGEHHFSRYGLGSAILTIAALLAGVTRRLRIGTSVLVLPFYHPITLAEEIATVDLLSGGRFELGIGRGYQWSEFHQLNIPLAESRARFDEAIEIMKKAWTEDEFDYRGRFWTFNGIRVLPKPKRRPHPPITIAATSPGGFRQAAERGYNVFLGGSTGTLENAIRNLAVYRETLAGAGYTFDPDKLRVVRPVYLADSPAEARAETEGRMAWFVETQRRVVTPPNEQWDLIPEDYRQRAVNIARPGGFDFEAFYHGTGIFGPPEECIRRIAEIDRVLGGVGEIVCSFTFGGWDQRKILQTMERFARDVMPHFQEKPAPAALSRP